MSLSKPVIYISSTIYDFQDLRSALKFWLEELGYEVMLSDFNDFTKPLETNSYEACLRAIARADYFILLIGARVGGFYDAVNNISITRMEYRTAYELVKQGRMRLVTFVRQDLWNVREDRKALKEFLLHDYKHRKDLEPRDIDDVSRHPSTFVNNAEATFDFLREVGKVDEMKVAMDGKGPFPVANWIYQFSTFQEVIEALGGVFETRRSLNEVALTLNLKREIISILQALTGKLKDGEIVLDTFWANLARQQLNGKYEDSTSYPKKYIRWLIMYLAVKTSGDNLSTQFIEQALMSGEYLTYDSDVRTYHISGIHNGFLLLQDRVHRLQRFNNEYVNSRIEAFLLKYNPADNLHMKAEDDVVIPNQEVMLPFAIYDTERDISDLCIALLKALDGDDSKLLTLPLRPLNPIPSMADELNNEQVTIEEIAEWIKLVP